MYRLTQTIFYQQLANEDTSVSIRRSEIETDPETGGELIGNHHRLTVDCLTFSQNQNYLHERLIKLVDGSVLDLSTETQLKTDLDNLKAELIGKNWNPDSQLITDYQTWQNSQTI